MKINRSSISGIAGGLIFGLIISSSISTYAYQKDNSYIPALQLKKFSEVMDRIKRDYVEEVDQDKLISDAISGMLAGLDPHSGYLDENGFKELQIDTSGKFGGLGIEVGMENGFIKVISPIDDTPAQRAGVKAGDLIIRLNDTHIKGKDLNEAVNLMRGEPGEPVVLTIVREGKDKPLKIKVVRAIIKIKSVKQRLLESNYGYLRVSSFQSNTADVARDALKSLKKENNGRLKGLVLDLRNNPGGILGAAVGISDLFLTEGKIVYTEGRISDSKMRYDATDFDVLDGAPIVVLVNQGSASASEIVSGALQDHKRALILGQKTFGKGSVQTVLPLIDSTTAIKLTTARYFTPSGRSIQAKGIEPDIAVEQLEFEKHNNSKNEDDFGSLTEASLGGHLSNPDDGKKSSSKKKSNKIPPPKNLVKDDYQLFEALNILKGMNIIQAKK